jgi:hypothetical protein
MVDVCGSRQGPTTKFVAFEVPPTQSAVIEDVTADVFVFVDNVTGCDCGGLTTVTCATDAAARSSAVTAACN